MANTDGTVQYTVPSNIFDIHCTWRLEEISAFITNPALIKGPALITFMMLQTRRLLEAGGY